MKKISLKNKILKRLMDFEGTWVHRGKIEERSKEWGYLAENGNRRCRELVNEGRIEKKEEKGSVLYRYVKKETKEDQIISSKTQIMGFDKPIMQTTLW